MNHSAASADPANDRGDRSDLDRVFSLTYEELRRLASTVRRDDPATTLSPTTLVNETWLKLSRSPEAASTEPLHFKRIAARAMRQVLIEAARRRRATKRGGAEPMVTFDDSIAAGLAASVACADDILELNEAIEALGRFNPRQAAIVESRFFGGFDTATIAESLGISEATVLRDWRAARAWLALQLRGGS